MEHEQRDSYLIPPNFIEGGTLMGGIFRTRNVIEAGVLGAAVGLPVLNLGFSLTTRIIILCLTALPLVLLALIGVGGSSLSSFILLFFSYLRNRRVLSQDAPARGRDGKELSMLPTWLQSKRPAEEQEAEAQPKSKSRFQVDLKARKLDQFKTFLEPEEVVVPSIRWPTTFPLKRSPTASSTPEITAMSSWSRWSRSTFCSVAPGNSAVSSTPLSAI